MIKEAIEKILFLARPELVKDDDGRQYILRDRDPVIDPYPDYLSINTLSGIVDFFSQNVEPDWWHDCFVHVNDYNKVVLYQGACGDFNQRQAIIISTARACGFVFGRSYSYEDFIIALHSQFVQNEDRDYILKFISSVRIDANAKVEDDGISQTVTAKSGLSSLVKDIPIKNVVHLRPFRTFTDIEQPESVFVFRMKIEENKPVFSIHEADGSAWKQTAIELIKNYFKTVQWPTHHDDAFDLPVIG